MTEHVIRWWEAEDGKMFQNDMDCMAYELNLAYKKSGVKFYIGDKRVDTIETENDKTYNEITDIYIDRSKEEENREFCFLVRHYYGWSLIEAAIEGNGTHYEFIEGDGIMCTVNIVEAK